MKKLSKRGLNSLLVLVLAFLIVVGLSGTTSRAALAATTPAPLESTAGDSTDPAVYTVNAQKLLAASSGTNKICLNADRNKCLVVHGLGQQLTIQGTGTTPSRFVFRDGGSGLVMIQTSAGTCLRANSDNTVTTESGNCSSGQDGERWIVADSSPFRFISYKFRNDHLYLASFGNNPGDKVWALNPEPGGLWISWIPL